MWVSDTNKVERSTVRSSLIVFDKCVGQRHCVRCSTLLDAIKFQLSKLKGCSIKNVRTRNFKSTVEHEQVRTALRLSNPHSRENVISLHNCATMKLTSFLIVVQYNSYLELLLCCNSNSIVHNQRHPAHE